MECTESKKTNVFLVYLQESVIFEYSGFCFKLRPKRFCPGKTVFCGWAFSPERDAPGNPDSVVAKIPKIVGGYSPKCLEKAVELYRCASDPSDPGELLV